HGDGCDGAPDLLEHQALLDDPVAATAGRLGQADAEQPGLGQGLEHVAVEAVDARLHLAQALLDDLVLEDALGQVADGVLLLAEAEVHRSVPSTAGPGACPGRPWR